MNLLPTLKSYHSVDNFFIYTPSQPDYFEVDLRYPSFYLKMFSFVAVKDNNSQKKPL